MERYFFSPNSRGFMTINGKVTKLAILLVASFFCYVGKVYGEEVSFFCSAHEQSKAIIYYSDVFSGPRDKQKNIENAFYAHLTNAYSARLQGSALCFIASDKHEAKADKDRQQVRERDRFQILETGWEY
jgi:hypothetical protein